MLLVLGGSSLALKFMPSSERSIVAVNESQWLTAEQVGLAALRAAVDTEILVVDTADEGKDAVGSGAAVLFVHLRGPEIEAVANTAIAPTLQILVTSLAERQALMSGPNGPHEDAISAIGSAKAALQFLKPHDPDSGHRLLAGIVVMSALWIFLILFGITVAQGVVEEKSSRVIEILLSTVRPWHVMAGKILGIGIVGLAQVTLFALVGMVFISAAGITNVPNFGWEIFVILVVWFPLGYVMFASVLAAAGALVSRQEDVQSVVQPAMILISLPFVVGMMFLTDDPNSVTMEVLSMVPPFSPILMPARMALGVADTWQVLVSIAATIAAIFFLVALSARIYSRAVLKMGSKVSWSEAFLLR